MNQAASLFKFTYKWLKFSFYWHIFQPIIVRRKFENTFTLLQVYINDRVEEPSGLDK